MVKKKQRQPQKVPKSPEFVEAESDNSDDNGEEEEPMVKRIHKLTKKAPKPPRFTDINPDDYDEEEKEPVVKKLSKSLGLVKTGSENSGDPETEDTLRTTFFPIDKSFEVGKNEEEPVLNKGIYRAKKNIICRKI